DLAIDRARLASTDYVLEIGSNDGGALKSVLERGHRAVGIDPSADQPEAERCGYEVVRDYFTETTAKQLRERLGRPGLILTRHTLEHAFDPVDFFRGISELLSSGGIAVIEVPYLRAQVLNNQFQSLT